MSFKIGDIVTPKPAYIGNGYRFKIISDIGGSLWSHWVKRYKLERVVNLFDPLYGPFQYQMDKLKRTEELLWSEAELDNAWKYNPKPYEYGKQNDAVDSLTYATQVMGVPINQIKITGESIQKGTPTPDKPQEIKNKNLFDGGELMYNYYKNIKEDKTMKILEIYKERKEEAILEDYNNQRDKILAEDEIQKIIKEMVHQVNSIFENEEREDRLYIDSKDFYQEKTMDKLDELDELKENEIAELDKTIEEIEAMFEMTEDYEERMKILKKYGIINKDGKLSI